MGTELIEAGDADDYGPAMQALNPRQRQFVICAMEHPTYSATQLAKEAGYAEGPNGSATVRVTAHRLMHDEKILAAMNEEAGKRLRSGGLIGVNAVIAIALNPTHKDHLKAALALMDRTGHHATSEHKVTVDDKRPETKAELIAAVKRVAAEVGLDAGSIAKLTGENVVDADFTVVDPVAADIAKQMMDL